MLLLSFYVLILAFTRDFTHVDIIFGTAFEGAKPEWQASRGLSTSLWNYALGTIRVTMLYYLYMFDF